MELAKLKELLSQKIDTQDKLVEILAQETELSRSYYPSKLEDKFVGEYTLNGFYRGGVYRHPGNDQCNNP